MEANASIPFSFQTPTRSGIANASQREGKLRAFPRLGPRGDATAVSMHDPLHGRQTDARTGELAVRMQAPEWTEQVSGVSHVEPGAVVPHEVRRHAVTLAHAELD